MIWFLETASLVWKSCVSHVVPGNHEKPRRFQQPWWEENFRTWELKTQYPIGVGNWRKKGLQMVFNKSFTMKLKRRLKILLKLPLKHGFYSSLTFGIRTNSKSINETNPIKIRSPLLASKITISAKVFFFLDFWWLHSCSVKRAAKMAEVRLRAENTADVHKPIRRILIKNHVDHFWPLQNVCAKSLRKKRTNPWIFFKVVPENEHQLESFSNWVFFPENLGWTVQRTVKIILASYILAYPSAPTTMQQYEWDIYTIYE